MLLFVPALSLALVCSKLHACHVLQEMFPGCDGATGSGGAGGLLPALSPSPSESSSIAGIGSNAPSHPATVDGVSAAMASSTFAISSDGSDGSDGLSVPVPVSDLRESGVTAGSARDALMALIRAFQTVGASLQDRYRIRVDKEGELGMMSTWFSVPAGAIMLGSDFPVNNDSGEVGKPRWSGCVADPCSAVSSAHFVSRLYVVELEAHMVEITAFLSCFVSPLAATARTSL